MGSATGDASKIYSPFGSKPNYTNMQQVSFDNAGKKALGGSIAYDFGHAFAKYGLSGLSLGLWDTQGCARVTRPPGPASGPQRTQYLAAIPPDIGSAPRLPLQNPVFRHLAGGNTRNPQSELRVVLDYTVLFRPPLQYAAR